MPMPEMTSGNAEDNAKSNRAETPASKEGIHAAGVKSAVCPGCPPTFRRTPPNNSCSTCRSVRDSRKEDLSSPAPSVLLLPGDAFMIRYARTTRGIRVTVRPIYLDEPSDLLEREFAFGYAVHITNTGPDKVQLLRRRWIIEEANGSRQDLSGDGPLRPHPVIAPGETHVHDGACTIASFNGTVQGNYLVQRADGEQFNVSMPSFPLQAAAN